MRLTVVWIMIDETDVSILNILRNNSRLSAREIAKNLKLSTATVIKHINSMEKERVIRKYSAILDYDKLGFDVQVIINLNISKGKLFEVERKIANHPSIFALYDNTGGSDATVIAKFKNRRAMDNFLKRIQSYPFVERTETKLILNTIKEDKIRL